jgi:hypothetical protein
MTDAEITILNKFQKSGKFHPLTCGGNRTDKNHLDGEGILVATKEGWVCPYCDYKQPFRGFLENICLKIESDTKEQK